MSRLDPVLRDALLLEIVSIRRTFGFDVLACPRCDGLVPVEARKVRAFRA